LPTSVTNVPHKGKSLELCSKILLGKNTGTYYLMWVTKVGKFEFVIRIKAPPPFEEVIKYKINHFKIVGKFLFPDTHGGRGNFLLLWKTSSTSSNPILVHYMHLTTNKFILILLEDGVDDCVIKLDNLSSSYSPFSYSVLVESLSFTI